MIVTKTARPIFLNIGSISTTNYRKITHCQISNDNSLMKIEPFLPKHGLVLSTLMLKYNFRANSKDLEAKSGAEKTSIYLIKHATD